MTATHYLQAKNIEIHAGDYRLLSDVNFTVKNGRGLILRGANGIGKTSLLAVLAGLKRAAAGSIKYESSDQSSEYDISQNAHYLGHKRGLKNTETVLANLSFFAKFYNAESNSLPRVIEQLSLTRLQNLPVRVLSAGQKQRTAFARLLLAERPIWLLDEPTASLDSDTSSTIENVTIEHLKKGGTVIAATHLPFLSASSLVDTLDLQRFVPQDRWVDST